MEAIFLVCGAGGPQLKRNPLGSLPFSITPLLIGLAVLCGIVSVIASGVAADRLSVAGPQRREATEFALEYRLWYLEPSSFQDGGYLYSIIAVICGLVAFGVTIYFVVHGLQQAA
jgi:hypothetical protein